jgi:hypothetical protein
MKKIKYIFIVLTMLFIFATNITAVDILTAENFYDGNADDISEISELREQTANWVNFIIDGENTENLFSSGGHSLINPADIDFNNMFKLYTDTNKILTENLVGQRALDVINNSDYLWILPLSLEDITVTVTFQKGPPLSPDRAHLLSDEDIERIIANEGKWEINSVSIDYLDTRYEDTVRSANDFFTSNEGSALRSIDNTVYFIAASVLRTTAGIVITDEENYIKCFSEGMNQFETDTIEISKNFLPQAEIIKLIERLNLNNSSPAGGFIPSDEFLSDEESVSSSIDNPPVLNTDENLNAFGNNIFFIIAISITVLLLVINYLLKYHRRPNKQRDCKNQNES